MQVVSKFRPLVRLLQHFANLFRGQVEHIEGGDEWRLGRGFAVSSWRESTSLVPFSFLFCFEKWSKIIDMNNFLLLTLTM